MSTNTAIKTIRYLALRSDSVPYATYRLLLSTLKIVQLVINTDYKACDRFNLKILIAKETKKAARYLIKYWKIPHAVLMDYINDVNYYIASYITN